MVDLFALSRQYCVTICGFLIPINLLLTSCTLFFLVRQFSQNLVRRSAFTASFLALAMIAHVGTWLAVGVVMTPTYILLSLGTTCLTINGYAYFAPHQVRKLLGIA